MATPYPGMDPEYLKSLQAMIAAMGPSVADKDAAKYQGLLAMGLGLMGARKGQEFAAAGNAGLLGLDARNRSLAQATAEKGAGLNQALNAQQLQGAMQAQADDAGYRKAMQDRYAPAATQPAPFGAQGGAPASFGPAIAPAQGAAQDGARLSTSKLSDYEKAIQDAQYLEAKGVAPKYVEAAYAKAEKLRPKVKETRAVVDPQTGQRVLANIYEDGRIEIQKGAAPDMEKAHFLDVGNKIGAVDPFTGKPIAGGGMYNKEVDPNSQLSANVTMRGQNMMDARAREANANAAAAGNVVETADGFVRIGKDNTVTPILGQSGQLQPKPTGAVQQQIASNAVTMSKIDAAMGLVDKYPNAFGLKNMAGDSVMQRVDPSGVKARAMIADIAGQKIHDRSGAAVTVGESERLKPYVPNATDTPSTIKEKLSLFKKEYVAIQNELKGGKLLSELGGSSKVVKWSDLP